MAEGSYKPPWKSMSMKHSYSPQQTHLLHKNVYANTPTQISPIALTELKMEMRA